MISAHREWEKNGIPKWACPTEDANYTVAPFYRRLRSDALRFVPNFAYEAGVYLRFVVDYYQQLPPLTVFLRADAEKARFIKNPPVKTRLNT